MNNDPFGSTTQTGLEPVTSAVTGRRSNQLSHWAIRNHKSLICDRNSKFQLSCDAKRSAIAEVLSRQLFYNLAHCSS